VDVEASRAIRQAEVGAARRRSIRATAIGAFVSFSDATVTA
jgi:hypothetical protein